MFTIPPALPPAQYSSPTSQTSECALEELCAAKNLSFDVFEPSKQEVKTDIRLIAHRGFSSKAPENTIPAFVEAAKTGYKFVECDVQWTKDGVPVLLHDSTINRTAAKIDGLMILPKFCSSVTYDDLLSYDFGIKKGEEYRGTKIPTFEEFLVCCREYNLSPYIEIKADNADKEKIRKLTELVDSYGLTDKVSWISFNYDYLKTVSEIKPEARLGYLYSSVPDDRTVEELRGLQTGKNEVFLDAKAAKLTQNSVKLVKDFGFDVEVWTVDDFGYYDIASTFGCTGVTTDNITNSSVLEYYGNQDSNI